MHVIGIDAGGTKTVCLLADERGHVVAESRGGGANLQAAGELAVEKVLHRVMDDALGDSDVRPDAICLGIAGVDRPGDADAVRGIMRRIGFKTRILIVNDALIALVAGAGDRPGVVVAAGTGSIAYGRDATNRAARSGGWGYLLGDEGGGFWIGRAAMAAVVRQFDGRGPATLLTELVLAEMGLANPTELIHAVYDRGLHHPSSAAHRSASLGITLSSSSLAGARGNPELVEGSTDRASSQVEGRYAVASIAPVVQRAADAGDAVAAEILERAAVELAAAAASVITRLGMRGHVFPTVLAGGVFRGVPSLAGDVAARLAEVAPRSDVRRLEVEPAVGAVALALAAAHGHVAIPAYM